MYLRNVLLVVLMILAQLSIFGQSTKYPIEFQKMTGQLTQKDLYKEGFGRYDGYEIFINEGERVHFLIYTENFIPNLVLVSPTGQTYKEDLEKNDEYATIQAKISQSGEWVLYVLGDENSFGEYYFQYAIAGKNLFFIDDDADFCEEVDFLMAHSIAYFIFLSEGNENEPILKINGSTDAYIDGHDASYNANLYDGNSLVDAERMFNYIITEIKNCINKKWKVVDRGWMTVNDYREKYVMFTENVSKEPRYIRIGLLDFRVAPNANQNDFLVDINIGKK